MSIGLMSLLWTKNIAGMSQTVMQVLCDHANDDGYCWPSQGLVAWKAGCTDRTVRNVIREMEQAGAVEVIESGQGRGRTTVLRLHVDALEDKPPYEPKEKPEYISGLPGQKTGNPRHENRKSETRKPEAAISDKPPVEPSTESSVVNPPAGPQDDEEDFEVWWTAYPNKQKKPRARRAWMAARQKNLPALPQVLQALAQHRRSDQWTRDGNRYIPHPATWLNEEMWADRLPESGDSAGNVRRQPDFAGIDVEAEMRRMLGNPL